MRLKVGSKYKVQDTEGNTLICIAVSQSELVPTARFIAGFFNVRMELFRVEPFLNNPHASVEEVVG